ncbi:hypothetical protein NQ315_008108 [Exocentrus adspersus]|uniref:Osteopetrosis-associated transmembrane protein 1 n=1 Tax=Exocentrus adspersus TaxID=1586481 RepID=A0AAV8VWY7_9CUCU|nr:hypothetical protein NQ315_008108 [Exocentrus adspersus]
MCKIYLILVISLLTLYIHTKCDDIEIGNGTEDCTVLKNNFANYIAGFAQCSIDYSRPITLCKSCIYTYINLLHSFENLTQVSVNGTICLDYYVNLDRLQIIETQYVNSINLWNRAKCYECYLVENGTQTSKESEILKQFNSYYNTLSTCTLNTDTENLCRDCMADYVALSDYYQTISKANDKIGTCIDLEDKMNSTWNYWSPNCCKYRRHNEYVFIGSTISVIIITILLYISVHFLGEKKAPTIIQQSRFAESVNRL